MVYRIRHYEKHDITIDDFLPTAYNQVAGCNDTEVAHEYDMPQRYVFILMHYGCNDIRTSRASIAQKAETCAQTQQQTTHYAGQKRLLTEHHLIAHYTLPKRSKQCKDTHCIYGLDTEFKPQHLECSCQQQYVDTQIGVLNVDTRGPKHHRRYTGQASNGNLVR